MRFVTGVAGETSGVIGGDDLGKSLGLCAVGLATSRANDGGVGQLRLHRSRIVSVLALRFMAGLTGNVGMTAQLFLVYNVCVAALADVMPGKSRRAGGNLGDGGATVVAILAKALGNDGSAQQDEDCQENCDDDSQPDEMFDVLEHGCFPCAGRSEALKGTVILDTVYLSRER